MTFTRRKKIADNDTHKDNYFIKTLIRDLNDENPPCF